MFLTFRLNLPLTTLESVKTVPMQYLLILKGLTRCFIRISFISLRSLPSCLSSMITAEPRSAVAFVLKFLKDTEVSIVRRSVRALLTRVILLNDVSTDGETSSPRKSEWEASQRQASGLSLKSGKSAGCSSMRFLRVLEWLFFS